MKWKQKEKEVMWLEWYSYKPRDAKDRRQALADTWGKEDSSLEPSGRAKSTATII